VLEKFISDLLLLESPSDYDCALQSLYLYDVEGITDKRVPDIVEVTSYYLLIDTFREFLYVLRHCSSDEGSAFLQSEGFEEFTELCLLVFWKVDVSGGNEAAGGYFGGILHLLLAKGGYQRVEILFMELCIGPKLHLDWPSANFFKQETALSLTGGWSSEASTLSG